MTPTEILALDRPSQTKAVLLAIVHLNQHHGHNGRMTRADIARVAGCSTRTVSRVIDSEPLVTARSCGSGLVVSFVDDETCAHA